MQVVANTGEGRDAKEMEVEKVLHINKGFDHTSYAKNSLFQRTVTTLAGLIIEERIREVYVTLKPKCLMMAEMGCSSGPNALLVVSRITDIIDEASQSINYQCPQFGVFLNDLPGNDFNALFKLLPNFNQGLQEAKGSSFQPCFVSGIPKSFYRRVFPDNFLHFVHSSYSIHFLSQGMTEQEKLDEFNMPFYSPTVEEVRKLVEAEGSFVLNKLETFTIDWSIDTSQNLETRAKLVTKTIRAVTESLLANAFGHAVVDDLFLLFETRVKERLAGKRSEYLNIVLSVTKKE